MLPPWGTHPPICLSGAKGVPTIRPLPALPEPKVFSRDSSVLMQVLPPSPQPVGPLRGNTITILRAPWRPALNANKCTQPTGEIRQMTCLGSLRPLSGLTQWGTGWVSAGSVCLIVNGGRESTWPQLTWVRTGCLHSQVVKKLKGFRMGEWDEVPIWKSVLFRILWSNRLLEAIV